MSPAMSKLHINGRLYVDGMAPGTGDADLLHHFGSYGDVADIFVPTDRLTGAPRSCAFVHFSSPHDAGRALADPSHVINGREVYIARARPTHFKTSSVSSAQPNTGISPAMSKLHMSGRLYVDDIAPGTGDADLLRHFGRYGDVADIFVPTDRLTGGPRCCAFVQFSSPRDAGHALADPSHVINGREVYIARARPRHFEKSSVSSVQANTSMSPAMSRLHINGRLYLDDMAPGTGDADLRRHFGRYGEVADIFIPTYRLTGQPRCCAFVQFSNAGDARRALADPRHVINGRQVYIGGARPRHLEESSVYQYKPLCERRIRNGPWRGYRVGDIGKTSRGSLVFDSMIAYISEDGVQSWARPIRMHTESKSTGYGPRRH